MIQDVWARLVRLPRNLLSFGVDLSWLKDHQAVLQRQIGVLQATVERLDGRLASTDSGGPVPTVQGDAGSLSASVSRLSRQVAELEVTLAEMREARERTLGPVESVERGSVADGPPNDPSRGLFVVGHARSGTTVLTEALNTSSDVWLFGEANLHQSGSRPDFRSWYNAMHQDVFGNPRSKTTYCPALLDEPASGHRYLSVLAEHHKYVGEKVAFRDSALGYDFEGFLHYQERHFYTSHYLCLVRHPAHTLASAQALFEVADMSGYVRSYLRTLLLLVEMSQIFPNCRILDHEKIGAGVFDRLARVLDIDMSRAFEIYRHARTEEPPQDWQLQGITALQRHVLDVAWQRFVALYDPEMFVFRNGGDLVQVWQIELAAALRSLASEGA